MSQFTADTADPIGLESTEQLVHAVTTAVADAEGVEPWDLTPLYEAIDPEALESLVGTGPALGTDSSLRVTFEYQGYDVTVDADGDVDLSG